MEKQNNYVKRTQKDYTLSFKLQVVKEVESGLLSISESSKRYGIQGEGTVRKWLQKYGKLMGLPKLGESNLIEYAKIT